MKMFFYICDYFRITTKEFFNFEVSDPTKVNELMEISQKLNSNQLDILIRLAKDLRK